MKLLNKLLSHDKLKHLTIGTFSFIALDLYLSQITALSIILVVLFIWEVMQRVNGGKNDLKEIALDYLYGVILPILITIIY